MKPATRQWFRILLGILLAAATLRAVWIFYERRRPAATEKPVATRTINPDFYVHPPRSYIFDLNSARKLSGTKIWVRDGYRYPYFPYDPARKRSGQRDNPPLLPPARELTVRDVVLEPARQAGSYEANLIFDDPDGQGLRTVTIGHCDRGGGSCKFYFDEMFFLKNPRELFSHWTEEHWKAIERGEARKGMTETQISFALGFGRILDKETREAGEGERVVEFRPPNQPPVVVTFNEGGYAREIRTGQ